MKEKPMLGPGRMFGQFKEFVERHFLNVDIDGIKGKKEAFVRDLNKLGLNDVEVLENLLYFFSEVFWNAQLRTSARPLHTSRDFALRLFTTVFPRLFSRTEVIKQGIYVTKTDFMMFLAGINDDPYTATPMAETLRRYAAEDDSVLITGDTGTGKELHAKVIHYLSERANENFGAINCAGIPDTLQESELFGYVEGAFTGADKDKKGILEEVGNGTLFLDEIGDMSWPTQAKVLRVLQSGDYCAVGSMKVKHFDGRVIAATNRDLESDIKASPPKFRPDLFYRLNVLPVRLPSLAELEKAERLAAILNKVRHVIYRKSGKPGDWKMLDHLTRGGPAPIFKRDGDVIVPENDYISDEAVRYLMNYDFPGNYRELDNIITRTYIFSEGKRIEVTALPDEVINFKKSELWESRLDEISPDDIFLKDIVEHAEKIKKDIVRRKLKSVCGKGGNLKGVLYAEGITDIKGYNRIWKRIRGILGREEMSRIIGRQ